MYLFFFFFFQAEDGIRDSSVTGVQTCALPISRHPAGAPPMIALRPASLEGHGVRLEPLSPGHRDGLIAAASDGRLWELWYTFVPGPQQTSTSRPRSRVRPRVTCSPGRCASWRAEPSSAARATTTSSPPSIEWRSATPGTR